MQLNPDCCTIAPSAHSGQSALILEVTAAVIEGLGHLAIGPAAVR
jgi:hypothetical protein